MSSIITFLFEEEENISDDQWKYFCAANEIIYSPSTAGQNIFYTSDRRLEIQFGSEKDARHPPKVNGSYDWNKAEFPKQATDITFRTCYHALDELTALARKFWFQFGGFVYVEDHLRSRFCRYPDM